MEDKPWNTFSSVAPAEHQYHCDIWEIVKSGNLEILEGRRRILGQLMLEHPEYQYFWEIPYQFVESDLQKAFKGEGVDPDLHLATETDILEQIQNENPPEIYEAYKSLLSIGVEAHEARHVICRVFTEMVFEGVQMAKRGQQPDEDFYLRRIRHLAKHPKKVIKDQERKWQKGL